MAKEDFYDILGVVQNSSSDEIKKAYRKKAMQYHPDRNQGDDAAEQRFKEINEAYDVLKDDQKRAAYDQFGHSAFDGSGGGGGFGGGGFADIFDEMFGDFTGRARSGGGPARGSDLRYNFEITLVDAFGQIILHEDKKDFIGEYTKMVDISNWPRGIYMVQIKTQDSFVSKRIVLQ